MKILNNYKDKIISLIYKLQKIFKVDLIYLLKGEFWLIIGKAITTIGAFALALALAIASAFCFAV